MKIECFFKNTGKNLGIEIMSTFGELMRCVVRQSIAIECTDSDGRYHTKSVYVEPPEAGLSRELYSYEREVYVTCLEYVTPDNMLSEKKGRNQSFITKCQTKSLCAAVLWKKVELLALPMTIDETIKNRCD